MAGHEFSYKCKYCAFEEYFKQGHGYLVRPQSFQEYKNTNQKFFHYEIHNKIVRLHPAHPDMVINATFQVYKCPKCNVLYDKVQVTLTDGQKSLHTNRFKCSRCKSRLKLTNIHRLKRARCPVCGKPSYQRQKKHVRLWET
ncbi:MAG TPA: hypothetical protein PLW67_08865 [Prolixibacteraceae bacterium]|nr:hypothetical protein [Prolixibacteraceae bacterium]